MSRLIEGTSLFAQGSGISTCAPIECEVCGEKYNEGIDTEEGEEGDWIRFEDFCYITVCECCFKKVEDEVLAKREILIDFFKKAHVVRKKIVEKDEALLSSIELKDK